jgi:hypothetical protein
MPEVRRLPSTAVTRLRQYYAPVRLPSGPPSPGVQVAIPGRSGLPRYPDDLADVPSPIPRRTRQAQALIASPPVQAFPYIKEGQRPHYTFRGLLRVHSRYGPQACSTAQGGLCHRASTPPVAQRSRLSATGANQQLSGWNLPPLVIRALVAHLIQMWLRGVSRIYFRS